MGKIRLVQVQLSLKIQYARGGEKTDLLVLPSEIQYFRARIPQLLLRPNPLAIPQFFFSSSRKMEVWSTPPSATAGLPSHVKQADEFSVSNIPLYSLTDCDPPHSKFEVSSRNTLGLDGVAAYPGIGRHQPDCSREKKLGKRVVSVVKWDVPAWCAKPNKKGKEGIWKTELQPFAF